MAMPVPVCPGKAQGAGPKVNATLNTFLPEGLGVTVPLNLQPEEPAAVNAPLLATLMATLSPVRLLVDHAPATEESVAGLS